MDAHTPLNSLEAARVCAGALRVDPAEPGTARLALALGDALGTELVVGTAARSKAAQSSPRPDITILARRERPEVIAVPVHHDPYRLFPM